MLSLDLDDKYITTNLNQVIQDSYDWFNDVNNYNLKNKRLKNQQMLEGRHLQEHKLYRHQTPYIDNEMFVGVDAIVAYVTAQTPKSEVYPASKSPESKILATDLESYHKAHSEKFELACKLEGVVYGMLGKYVGLLKLRWDPLYGTDGEIVPEVVDPDHVIIDKNAKRGENPRFICHVLKCTIEELIAKFPKKEAQILAAMNIQRRGAKNVTAEVAYREVWFTYYDKENKPQEAVAWYIKNLVLDKCKSPNWLYEGEGENFLDYPMKPFIPFNMTNDGSHWVDKTNAVEQAVAQQEIHNKVGRQIIDNLATANGFKAIDANAMTKDDAQNFTGDPNQLLLIKTKPNQNVKDAIGQFQPQLVSQQLIEYLGTTTDAIHGILGTPSQFRGDDEDLAKTATTNTMVKNQASGRQDKIVRAVDYAMDKYFKLLTQMICVWYDKKHYATVNGGDGNFDFIEMHKNKVESGMTVRVQSGTTLPFDKARQESVAQNAAELGLLAPYDYYKLMHMDNPQKLYDNMVKWKTAPQQLAVDVLGDEADRMAVIDFTELMGGNKVKQRDDVTAEYIEQMRKLMISDEYLKAKASLQNSVIKFVTEAANNLALRTELDQMSAQQPPATEPLPAQVMATGLVPPSMPAMGSMPLQGMPMASPPPMGAPMPGSPIQGIMQAQPPSLNPAVPQMNSANVGQLPPV